MNTDTKGKTKITIEYPLTTKSAGIVWQMIGNAHGLEKWMADHVETDQDTITFTWGEPWTEQDIRKSVILQSDEKHLLRLRWEENSDEDYWELRIEKSEFSGSLSLIITDHVTPDEEQDVKDLWHNSLSRLHAASGL